MRLPLAREGLRRVVVRLHCFSVQRSPDCSTLHTSPPVQRTLGEKWLAPIPPQDPSGPTRQSFLADKRPSRQSRGYAAPAPSDTRTRIPHRTALGP